MGIYYEKNTMRFLLLIILLLPLNTSAIGINIFKRDTITPSTLENFNRNPEKVKHIIKLALQLSRRNLGYKYGSARPEAKGMDCSGTIYYLLNQMGFKNTPRSSYMLYQWILKYGNFHRVNGSRLNSRAFSRLKPGDLLFWTGTYNSGHKYNVSHVMIYIGKTKTGNYLMAGSSNGRTYKGRKVYGVSVFDFQLPRPSSGSRFIGYSCIPGINCR